MGYLRKTGPKPESERERINKDSHRELLFDCAAIYHALVWPVEAAALAEQAQPDD